MATTTTHYSLKKYEGADLFNPLTYENLNADAIDQAMYDNKQQAIGPATELTAGTVHAITRANTDSPIFAFTATSNFAEGDTFTVDGTPVTALTTSGETLPAGAYVIGAEVIGYLRSTSLTLFVFKKTDLTGIQSDITAIDTIIGATDISGIADGTLTGAVADLSKKAVASPITYAAGFTSLGLDPVTAYVSDGLCIIRGSIFGSYAADTDVTVGTVNAAITPASGSNGAIASAAMTVQGGGINYYAPASGVLRIRDDGTVHVVTSASGKNTVSFMAIYAI